MARNINSKKGMTAGLFNTSKDMKDTAQLQQPVARFEQGRIAEPFSEIKQGIETEKKKERKAGRPRDADLQEGEEIKSTTIQLTDDTIYQLDAYLLNNKPKSRSQVIRELIRKHL